MTLPATPEVPTWWPLMQAVSDCLCDFLAVTVGGPPGRCCPVPGSAIILDDCCKGTAWVRLERIGETLVTGRLMPQAPISWGYGEPCGGRRIVVVLAIGVMRCAASIDEHGNPPSCDTLTKETLIMMSDVDALYRTASCCLPDPEIYGIYHLEPSMLTPAGPAGGCVGSELTVGYTVDLCPCIDVPVATPIDTPHFGG